MFVRNFQHPGKADGSQPAARRSSTRKLVLIWGLFTLMMHGFAFVIVIALGKEGPAAPQGIRVMITMAMLGTLTLMLSASLRASVEALFERGDLDLLLSSPLSSHSVFAVRLAGVVLGTCGVFLFFLGPLAHAGLVLGQWRWLGIYPVIICMAVLTSSLAMLLTLGLVRLIGVRRTRVAAQVLAALAGAALFIVSQAGNHAMQERGRAIIAQVALLLQPGAVFGPDSLVWLPARAALGDPVPMLVLAGAGALIFFLTVRFTHRFFIDGVQQAVSAVRVAKRPPGLLRMRFGRSLALTIMIKEWRLIARDPQLISQVLLQLLYLLPILLPLFGSEVPSLPAVGASLTFLCGLLTGSLAWIIISAEEAPDLLRASPCNKDTVKLAKMAAAVLPPLGLALLPLAWLALHQPLAALVIGGMIAVSGANNALVVKWCARPATRADFKMRGKGNVLASLFELLGGLAWGGTAFALLYAAAGGSQAWLGLVGAAAGAVLALVILGAARYFRPDGD